MVSARRRREIHSMDNNENNYINNENITDRGILIKVIIKMIKKMMIMMTLVMIL